MALKYFPEPQFTHVSGEPARVVGEYLPAEHRVHAVSLRLPLRDENLPATQELQSFSEARSVSLENVPTGQSVHAGAPRGEYVPPPQDLHSFIVFAAGAGEYLPALQRVHSTSPWATLYCPGGHAVHPPFSTCPVYPAAQKHVFSVQLPGVELELGGHALHWSTLVEPSAGKKVPAGQSVQLPTVLVSLYLPMVHNLQVLVVSSCPSVPVL